LADWLVDWLIGLLDAGRLACWLADLLIITLKLGAPRSERHIKLSGADFIDFRSQGQKVIKSKLLGLILLTSGAKVTKSLNQDFWG
jgi:hypothetical protein